MKITLIYGAPSGGRTHTGRILSPPGETPGYQNLQTLSVNRIQTLGLFKMFMCSQRLPLCQRPWECDYFFLYPTGHKGFTSVTFLVSLPLTQVIVVFFCAILVFTAFATASCFTFNAVTALASDSCSALSSAALLE